jgi:hypothetical protein
MHHILDVVYSKLEVAFPWEKGDRMMVDNVLAARGRNPYTGTRRQLVVPGDMRSHPWPGSLRDGTTTAHREPA